MDKRHQRMLEETLTLPGNETCADCHSPAPRWASVNLGIFLCVHCASVHRKLGTHKSRVKSVTLDTWSREHITSMRSIGNTASNAIYNPNENLHPPPTAQGNDERDSDLERYIRRKYEQGAFKAGAKGGAPAPTSLNRARERDGRLAEGSVTGLKAANGISKENRRNPELNDVLFKQRVRERDLPAVPADTLGVRPRQRPTRSVSANVPVGATSGTAGVGSLIDLGEGTSSTRPLQVSGLNSLTGLNGISSATTQGYPNGLPTPGLMGGQSLSAAQWNPSAQPGEQYQPSHPVTPNGMAQPFGATGLVNIPNNNPFHALPMANPWQQPVQHPSPFQQPQLPTQQSPFAGPSSFTQQSYFPSQHQQHPQQQIQQQLQHQQQQQPQPSKFPYPTNGYQQQHGFLAPQNTNPFGQLSPSAYQNGSGGGGGYFSQPQQPQPQQWGGMGMADYGQMR